MPPSISGSIATRFTWTYNRAASAMLTTTATTALCLLLNATAPFPSFKTFGIFNAFIVICDYVLVITWYVVVCSTFPTYLLIYRCVAVMLTLLTNLNYTRYAATTVCLTQLVGKICPPGSNFEFSCCCPGAKVGQQKKERRATAFFRDKLAPLTFKPMWKTRPVWPASAAQAADWPRLAGAWRSLRHDLTLREASGEVQLAEVLATLVSTYCRFKLRWPLIALTTTLLIGGVVATATLFTDGEPQNWTDGHQMQRLLDIQSNEFGDPDEPKLTTTLIYGLADHSVAFPTSVDLFQQMRDDYDDQFELKFKSGVSYGPELQEKIVADCEALRSNSGLVPVRETGGAESYCLLNDLKEHAGTAFPYADETKLRAALDEFYSSEKYEQLTSTYSGYRTSTNFVIDSKGTSMTLWQSFNTTIPIDVEISTSAIQPYYDKWRTAVDKQCDAEVVLTQRNTLFAAMAGLQGSMW